MNATNEFTCYRQHNYHNFSGNVQRRTISMIYYRCFRQTFPSIADHVKSKSRRGMASWHVTGYYKCYHCMPDYFEFVNSFLNQGHRALLGDGPYLVQVPYTHHINEYMLTYIDSISMNTCNIISRKFSEYRSCLSQT